MHRLVLTFLRAPAGVGAQDPLLALKNEVLVPAGIGCEFRKPTLMSFAMVHTHGEVECTHVRTVGINTLKLTEEFSIQGPFQAEEMRFVFSLNQFSEEYLLRGINFPELGPERLRVAAFRRGLIHEDYQQVGLPGNYVLFTGDDATAAQEVRVLAIRPANAILLPGASGGRINLGGTR